MQRLPHKKRSLSYSFFLVLTFGLIVHSIYKRYAHLGIKLAPPANLGTKLARSAYLGFKLTCLADLSFKRAGPAYQGFKLACPAHLCIKLARLTYLNFKLTWLTYFGFQSPLLLFIFISSLNSFFGLNQQWIDRKLFEKLDYGVRKFEFQKNRARIVRKLSWSQK